MVTEVVLFSIVAFKKLTGSVATHLRCGGTFSDKCSSDSDSEKTFQNQSIFDEVKAYITKCASFFGPPCI